MTSYVARRIGQALPVALFASVIIFAALRLVPGDPALILAGPDPNPTTVAAIRESLGLNRPLPVQYLTWAAHAVHGDFGTSYMSGIPVGTLIFAKLPNTLELAVAALLLAVLIAFPLAVLAATRAGEPAEVVVNGYAALGLGIPNFWLGILLILVFALWLHVLPSGGQTGFNVSPTMALRDLILPAVTLAVPQSAIFIRFIRASVGDVLHAQFVQTARSKGLTDTAIVWRHVLRNAMIPIITIIGIQFGRMLGGAVIVESIFAWPGLGRLTIDAINNKDYAVVQGALLLLVCTFIVVNLLVDLSYGLIDPRIRYS